MLFQRLLERWRRAPAASARGAGGHVGPRDDEEIDDLFLSRLRRASLASQRRLTSALTGEHPGPRKATALEFADYREYTPGDDFRRVDWNAYLRLNHLLVKMADAPERLQLHILLDASRSMASGQPEKFAYARRLAIGLAYVALSHMDSVNLMMLRDRECLRVSQLESARGMPGLVRATRSIRADGTTNLDAALQAFTAERNRRGVVVVISDLLSPAGFQAGLERLSGSALRPVVIHVLSSDETEPTLEGDMELEDVETGDTIQVSIDWATRNRYQQWLAEWLRGVEQLCSRRGISYLRAETSQSVEELLLGRLRREKVLK